MSTAKFQSISNLHPGKYDYKIKVRVIRLWRGVTRTGEEFKGFNIIVLDNMKNRIHAFIPGVCAPDLEDKIKLGKLCSITNFTVQMYKPEDIFRCVRNDKQLIFTRDTTIDDLEDNGTVIRDEVFDFYDHSELKELAGQNTYLTDVVGVIQKIPVLRELKNRHGNIQKQAKFGITDGSSNINVTFWDTYAERFINAINAQMEKPIIIIISCCRVSSWNGQVDLSNVGATKYYLNYSHHSVLHFRKMLTKPDFSQKFMAEQQTNKMEVLKVEAIKKLGKEYTEIQVLTHVNISYVHMNKPWFFRACTTCNQETIKDDTLYYCQRCVRVVPYPEIKFKLNVVASDETGGIEIILEDREVRTLIGKRAYQLLHKEDEDASFPPCLKSLAQKDYTIQLLIKESNIVHNLAVYSATNICNTFITPQQLSSPHVTEMALSSSQATSSTYNAQGMSEVNLGAN